MEVDPARAAKALRRWVPGGDVRSGGLGPDRGTGGLGRNARPGRLASDLRSGRLASDLRAGRLTSDLRAGRHASDLRSGRLSRDLRSGRVGLDLRSGRLGRDLRSGRLGRDLRSRAAGMALGASVAVLGATALEVRRRATVAGLRGATPDADLVRGVAARMTTPLLPDDYLRLLNPLWTAREVRGRVVKVVPETDDAATLVIKPGWGWSFDYQPGQYVGIGVSLDGRWQWRSYSITSEPKEDQGHFSITVKAMPEGLLSSHLVGGLDPGTIVRLAVPQGNFVLPDPPPPKVLFWTGGSGITPIMAMLRTLVRRNTMPDVVHIHAAPHRGASIFASELQALATAHPTYRLIEAYDDAGGRIDAADIGQVCPDWTERDAWVCGPASLLDAAEAQWRRAGAPGRLHVERFSVARTAEAEGGTVTFSESDRRVEVDGATSLLEAGEKAGIQMPFGCRMGICHTCVLPLREGAVKDLRNGETYSSRQGIQTCVTAAAGDCTIQA